MKDKPTTRTRIYKTRGAIRAPWINKALTQSMRKTNKLRLGRKPLNGRIVKK